jgi:glyoxylase-like metal-dependent hydrolase (beta-lactamase superfamily II)
MPPEHVARISIGNSEFEGENNAYLLDRDGPPALLDTGLAFPEVADQLEAGLAEHDYTFADVTDVVLTHWHSDHTGLANRIQQAGGATVYLHEADAPMLDRDAGDLEAMRERTFELFKQWSVPDAVIEEVQVVGDEEEDEMMEWIDDVQPITDGDRITAGGFDLRTVHTPGHTVGHCSFELETDAGTELFSGDAVLPEYTPNVCGSDLRVEDPLETYLETLRGLAEAEYARAWPGHRGVVDRPTERIEEILEHHLERSNRILGLLDDREPTSTWEMAGELFGSLEGVHVIHGLGEAHAHLDYLSDAGLIERSPEGYRLREEADTDLHALAHH